jgi:hypothetical protein
MPRKRAPWMPLEETPPLKRTTVFAVLPWRGDGMYRLADAVAVYKRRHAAEAFADKDTTGTLVVRELNEKGP